MLDQVEVLGLVLALLGVIGTIICLVFCYCPGIVKMNNNTMRYDRYGRPEAVLAPTENGHTGLGHHHTGFGHHHTGFGHRHTGLGQANGEFDFGIQQNPSILPSMQYDFNSNYPGAAVPPPYSLQDNGAFHPPNYAKF